MDALGFSKVILRLILQPHADLLSRDALCLLGRSPCMMNSKALCLAGGRGISEKCTIIEILMINEKKSALTEIWRWTDTHQQLADGLTQLGVRQQFVEKLRRGVQALRCDPLSPRSEVIENESSIRTHSSIGTQKGWSEYSRKISTDCKPERHEEVGMLHFRASHTNLEFRSRLTASTLVPAR